MKYGPRKPKWRTFAQWIYFLTVAFLRKYGRYQMGWCSSYACPHCGDYPTDDDDYPEGMLYRSESMTHSHPDAWGDVHDWDERWQCQKCGTVFEFTNGDY